MNYPNEQPKQKIFSEDAPQEKITEGASIISAEQTEKINCGTRSEGSGESETSAQSIIGSFIGKEKKRVDKYVAILEEMMFESRQEYSYADDTLEGIYECIKDCGRISDAQIKAINNIRRKPSEANEYGSYEYYK